MKKFFLYLKFWVRKFWQLICCIYEETKTEDHKTQDIELPMLGPELKKVTKIKHHNIEVQRWGQYQKMIDEQYKDLKRQAQTNNITQRKNSHFLKNKLPSLQFSVKNQLRVVITNRKKQYFYEIKVKADTLEWKVFLSYGDLKQVSDQISATFDSKIKRDIQQLLENQGWNRVPQLPQLELGSDMQKYLEEFIPEVQLWLDQIKKEPYFFEESFIKAFQYPYTEALKAYKLETQVYTYDEQEIGSVESQSFRSSQASFNPTNSYDISNVQVECFSYERSTEHREYQLFLIKFQVNIGQSQQSWECKKLLREIKEIHQQIQDAFGVTIPYYNSFLKPYEKRDIAEKRQQVNKYLQSLFKDHKYLCDQLFDLYGYQPDLVEVSPLKQLMQEKVEDQLVTLFDFSEQSKKQNHKPLPEKWMLEQRQIRIKVVSINECKQQRLYELVLEQYENGLNLCQFEVKVLKSFAVLKQLQRNIIQIYEGLNYKVKSQLLFEVDDHLQMKYEIESFFQNLLQLPRLIANKYFLDSFYLVDIQLKIQRSYDFTETDLKLIAGSS